MELEEKNYYKLLFDNQQEFFVESDLDSIEAFLNRIEASEFTGKFISLQLKESDPVHIRLEKLFSVQKARGGVIGAQTKLWRLL